MLNVLDLALAFPERCERLASLSDELSLSRNQMRMFDRFFGLDRFHCDHDLPLATLVGQACGAVLARNPEHDARLSHVAYCHTLLSTCVFDAEHPPILAPFAARGLDVFSATMNHCATGVSMLGVLDRVLGDDEVGLILIGDKAFHPAIRLIENTTVMGEAAAAVLVGHRPGRFQMLGTHTSHESRFWLNSGRRGERYLDGFDEVYLEFACDVLCGAMNRFGLGFDQIRYVLPHNVNVPSWYQIARRAGFDPGKLQLSTIGQYGHCFGADPFINLVHADDRGELDPSDLVLLFSIGLGATASCALMRVCGKRPAKP
ncbi:3-oxoacyl-[acyl-carrier-protein] synthase III C-terminal domain-containing protein [Azospirillum sp. A23]|uniref:3-oxoacyl-[acyl-carrier-protein] synthase III C-terminal domain-containing protein n=1 Tax=Azospirillum sp. A23 TaxID=3160608 RepID=UPI0036F2256F